ncbi:hypothetical protein NDU88_010441, partial [Pleurodeles waltl]
TSGKDTHLTDCGPSLPRTKHRACCPLQNQWGRHPPERLWPITPQDQAQGNMPPPEP